MENENQRRGTDSTVRCLREVKISLRGLSVFFGARPALRDIDLDIFPACITAVIGPAGSGKTTLLRALNRLHDLTPACRVEGRILFHGEDICAPGYDGTDLRRRVGMVFALPVPLPTTIRANVEFGLRRTGIRDRRVLRERVEQALRAAFLWDEVAHRLEEPALRLSGGQQQRLCLARTLAMAPEVILLDEPCSGLDPISTARIEEALLALKDRYTILLVTNNTMQAGRVADRTAFFLMGKLVEYGETRRMFTAPRDPRTEQYLTGRFG